MRSFHAASRGTRSSHSRLVGRHLILENILRIVHLGRGANSGDAGNGSCRPWIKPTRFIGILTLLNFRFWLNSPTLASRKMGPDGISKLSSRRYVAMIDIGASGKQQRRHQIWKIQRDLWFLIHKSRALSTAKMDSWSWYNLFLVWLAGFGILAAAYNMGIALHITSFLKKPDLCPNSCHRNNPWPTNIL